MTYPFILSLLDPIVQGQIDPVVLNLFAQYGYPAIVSGFLLYIIVAKLEKLVVRQETVEKALISQYEALKEYRQEVKENCEENYRDESRKGTR